MVTASAIALSEALIPEEISNKLLYPRLNRIREVSAVVAAGVVRAAQKANLDTVTRLRDLDDATLVAEIKKAQWSPYKNDVANPRL